MGLAVAVAADLAEIGADFPAGVEVLMVVVAEAFLF